MLSAVLLFPPDLGGRLFMSQREQPDWFCLYATTEARGWVRTLLLLLRAATVRGLRQALFDERRFALVR